MSAENMRCWDNSDTICNYQRKGKSEWPLPGMIVVHTCSHTQGMHERTHTPTQREWDWREVQCCFQWSVFHGSGILEFPSFWEIQNPQRLTAKYNTHTTQWSHTATLWTYYI